MAIYMDDAKRMLAEAGLAVTNDAARRILGMSSNGLTEQQIRASLTGGSTATTTSGGSTGGSTTSTSVTAAQIEDLFAKYDVAISAETGEDPAVRLQRLADEINSGQRTLAQMEAAVAGIKKRNPTLVYSQSTQRTEQEKREEEERLRQERGQAAANFVDTSGLPQALLDIYLKNYLDTGDPTRAMIEVRKSTTYETYFPGNRRDDGTIRFGEAEYTSRKEGVQERLAEFGFSPNLIDFGQLLRAGGSFEEAARAAQEAATRFTEPGVGPTALAQQYLAEFSRTGSTFQALENVRDSNQYESIFAGNRREDGSLLMDEPEYFAYKRGWQREFLSRNLDPDFFEGRGLFVANVEGELSINEVGSRLELIEDQVEQNVAEVSEFYATNYAGAPPPSGLREAMFASAIDPSVTQDIVERRVKASQIGGEAKLQGFARSVERAEQLARAGVNQQQARGLFGSAARSLPGLSATTARFNRGGTNLDQFEDAFALGDATQGLRIDRALQEEDASFSSRADVRRDNTGLSGLRVR